jgi:transcriptional regulator with XRE-family HTH domain
MSVQDFRREFGKRLKDLAERKGLSGSELGRLCGWHRTTVYHLYRGDSFPGWNGVVRLAQVLDVDEMDLFTFPQAGVRHAISDLTLQAPNAVLLGVKAQLERALEEKGRTAQAGRR